VSDLPETVLRYGGPVVAELKAGEWTWGVRDGRAVPFMKCPKCGYLIYHSHGTTPQGRLAFPITWRGAMACPESATPKVRCTWNGRVWLGDFRPPPS
jgi:hypothetical protein